MSCSDFIGQHSADILQPYLHTVIQRYIDSINKVHEAQNTIHEHISNFVTLYLKIRDMEQSKRYVRKYSRKHAHRIFQYKIRKLRMDYRHKIYIYSDI